MSCCECLKKSCDNLLCQISPELIDCKYSKDKCLQYNYCRHTSLVAVKDIFTEFIDNYDYNSEDIQLELRDVSNYDNKWYNKYHFFDFSRYTHKHKLEIRATLVTISVSLVTTQPSAKLIKYRIYPLKTPTIGQLKQMLAIEYMFAAESVSLYLSDTDQHLSNRQLSDDMAVKNAWFYPHFNRSVINVIPNGIFNFVNNSISQSNDLILSKLTTLSMTNEKLLANHTKLITDSLITAINANNDIIIAKQTKTINECYEKNIKNIIDSVINANKNIDDIMAIKMIELSTQLSDNMKKCFENQTKTIIEYKDNNDLINSELIDCLKGFLINQTKVITNYLTDILVDSETDTQNCDKQSVGQLVDHKDNNNKTTVTKSVFKSTNSVVTNDTNACFLSQMTQIVNEKDRLIDQLMKMKTIIDEKDNLIKSLTEEISGKLKT
ncbi:uncharacterized protein LOC128963755 [Oppia nitens]|uniref:uncharacterized protein LOC128963755 n=1 Tax=Oppia nitens TaxID=1686743 RepID=UPI0023DB65FE|nr:uncharacterized protein LOC128963755 [Oppia nitens]